MKYKDAMETKDKVKWKQTVKEEYDSFVKHKVFKPVKRKDVPKYAKVMTTTWAMKKKSSGRYRARCNMRGYEQRDGEHFDSHYISTPVTNDVTIRLMFILMIMAGWYGYLLDIKGAFLHGTFDNGVVIYAGIPEGFHIKWDPKEWV